MDVFSEMKIRKLPISDTRDLRHYTKSFLMGCVGSLITNSQNGMPEIDAKILMDLWLLISLSDIW